MLRKVTLNPCARVEKVSATSRMIEGISPKSNKLPGNRQIPHLIGSGSVSDLRGGLNGSTQHFLEVYSQESENLKSLAGVDLSAAPLCSDPPGNSRTGRFSSGSTVVRVRWCFRSSRVARDSADHRSRLSHPWPP